MDRCGGALGRRPQSATYGKVAQRRARSAGKTRDCMAIEKFIENEVKSNDVVLFMKGTPQAPMCGFSGQVVQILDHLGVSYKGLNVLDSEDLRQAVKSYSNWP